MAPMAAGLTPQEITDVIAFLTYGQASGAGAVVRRHRLLRRQARSQRRRASRRRNGFGVDGKQTRSLTARQAGSRKGDMKNLEVAWALAFPGQGSGTGASVLGDTIFIDGGGRLLALDAATGCAKWTYSANSRNTPSIGDIGGKKVLALSVGRDIHVVDAASGQLVWKASGQPQNGTGGSIRGGVVFAKDKIIVPLSASGVASGMNPRSECCAGHGSVVALNAADGKWVWEYHTMPEPTYNGQVNSVGVKQKGPSGAPIWSVPLIDEKRNRVIVTSGENTSHPGTDTSDAVIALDLATGQVAWRYQAMAADVWNMACDVATGNNGPNCPVALRRRRPRLRFRRRRRARHGQERQGCRARRPEVRPCLGARCRHRQGALEPARWRRHRARRRPLGHHDRRQRLYSRRSTIPSFRLIRNSYRRPASTRSTSSRASRNGPYAVKPDCAGERAKLVMGCETRFGFSAAPLVIDGAVVGGTLGGKLFVLDGKNGKVLKEIDTIGPKTTINPDVAGKGGSIDAHGISAGAGMIFVNSGYGSFGQTPGNLLIALKPAKK